MDKKIVNLGKLSGKVLVFGGVYSNLQALNAIITYAEKNDIPPENCICTGDIVGYCAQPEECILKFKNWGAKSILGNVEIQLNEGATDCGCDFKSGSRCDDFSKSWYPYAQNNLSKEAFNYISQLPHYIKFDYAGKTISVLHGSRFNVSEFIFKSTEWETKASNFKATQSDVIIAGHSGLPFYTHNEHKLWLNPGVIGMPANDGSPKVWFAVLDDHNNKFNFEYQKLSYDHKLASSLMLKSNLPEAYAKTLLTGIWDNTEILPETEANQQGLEIDL